MRYYKNIHTGRVIDEYQYEELFSFEQKDYSIVLEKEGSGDFITSTIAGAATDNAILGGLLGGDIIGGILGDLLSDSELF